MSRDTPTIVEILVLGILASVICTLIFGLTADLKWSAIGLLAGLGAGLIARSSAESGSSRSRCSASPAALWRV